MGPGSRIEVKDPTKVTEESKGEGKRGRRKSEAENPGSEKSEGRKGPGNSDRAPVAGAVSGSTQGVAPTIDDRGRKGEQRSKVEGEAKS